MSETGNVKRGFAGVDAGVRIDRMVFKTVSNAASAEMMKIENELGRQLDAILRGAGSSEEDAPRHPMGGGTPSDAYFKVKNTVKQLFVYLERVMVLSITQSISRHLTGLTDDQSNRVVEDDSIEERLPEAKENYEKRIAELSSRISEYEEKLKEHGKCDGKEGTFNTKKIDKSVDSLFRLTREATEMLEDLSKRYSEIRKEHAKLKCEPRS